MTLNTTGLSSTEDESEADEAHATGNLESTESDETEALSKDLVFELLKNQRRRDALRYLKDNDGEATLSDMAEHIAAKENGITVQALSSSQRKRVYIGLYQCHLPKMSDAGVIDFEKNRGDIELQPLVEQLDPYLEGDEQQADAPTPPTPNRHLSLAAALAVGVAAGLLGVPGFSVVPAAGWAVISTAALMVLTGVESYRYYAG